MSTVDATLAADARRDRRRCRRTGIVNALTIDVEDYFQVSAFAPLHRRAATGTRASAASSATSTRILELLAERGAHATFFTLGWIAERYPQLVRADRRRRATSSRATATAISARPTRARRCSSPTSASPRSCSRTSAGQRGQGLSRAELFGRRRQPVGVRLHRATPAIATARASIRSATITTACPTAPRFAHEVRRRPRRGAGDDDAPVRPQLAGRRRRLFPPAALRDVALAAAARQRSRRRAGDLLFPSVGNRRRRSRAFAGIDAKTRFRHYVNLDAHARRGCAACCATSRGAAWTTCSCAASACAPRAASR